MQVGLAQAAGNELIIWRIAVCDILSAPCPTISWHRLKAQPSAWRATSCGLCPAQETFEHYQRSTGFGNEDRVAAALAKWGPNRFVVPLPRFADMLKEQLVAPFFVFQVFCVGLWCLDDYW